MAVSPLRYPGGKKKVLSLLAPFWSTPHNEYREPFLGGASAFLAKPRAPVNWVNDADESVWHFWMAVQRAPDQLCRLIREYTPPTIETWHYWRQANIGESVAQGFRTLFLNRTCFSGILNAGPIGGIGQTGPSKVDARWNAKELCTQVMAASHKLAGVSITCQDFSALIEAPGSDVFLYLDPPYYHKGNLLYSAKMNVVDHQRLAGLLKLTKHRFLLTYDDCPEVRTLYDGAYFYERSWFYSVPRNRERIHGKELFVSNFPIADRRQEVLF